MPMGGRAEICVGSEWNEWGPVAKDVWIVSSVILDYLKWNWTNLVSTHAIVI